ncbi:hypothetical protein SAMN06297129_2375 [Pseudooceanicola antarcticus]|uniref:Glycosyl transferases group 1 n=1 Tax=Pseudooceanicola antarcticus TaxID=1247613 RepID=A0A285IXJ7_9RHOB|nr:hypothetical protein [Pseudooceanicola antarcticus]PJE25831.1 hypothetical protein CVM39_19200 [Pseudooceanicola antarcticus]SNY52678.1 hypothetical protein SAMN06297129_2375 [Pseudooceanicola antarcticus]
MTGESSGHVVLVSRQQGVEALFQEQAADELRQQGFRVSCCGDGDPDLLRGELVLIMGAVGSMRRTSRLLERNPSSDRKVAVWIFEPLPPPDVPMRTLHLASRLSPVHTGRHWTKPFLHFLSRPFDRVLYRPYRHEVSVQLFRFLVDNFAMLERGLRKGWLDRIFTSTEQKRLYLQGLGIEAEFAPVGQQPAFGRDLELQRDIDVVFIGSLKSASRRAELGNLREQLERLGLTVVVPEKPIWGEERTKLVNRAKVLVHLHKMHWDTPWMRWCLAAANGAAVASVPLSVPVPMRPGIDYLSAPINELAGEILSLVRDEPRRRAMVENCQSTIADQMTCAISVSRMTPHLRSLISTGS